MRRRLALAPALLLAAPLLCPPVVAQEAAKAAAVDPARVAEAKRTIDFVFPAGTYRKMMGGNFARMMGNMSSQMLDMPVRDLVAMTGAAPEEVQKMSGATMRQAMEVIDPAFERRNQAMFDGMMASMVDIMDGFEPEIREALVDVYAAKFTAVQLRELNGFFATPTGRLYAESAMSIAMDPVFMDKVAKLTPRIMQAMPKIVANAVAANKDLPPRKSWATMTQADRDRLTTLLGLSAADAEKAVEAIEKQERRKEAGAS